ncbi:MAG: hypothetical protein HQM09_15170 [Candidatus Riflebacteria bacterium]|nr:hypothetical protein [Candidatus Riflebacteria bacterium]
MAKSNAGMMGMGAGMGTTTKPKKGKKAKTKKKASPKDVPVPINDDKWMAESDARTLSEAEAIKCDPKRSKAACDAAKGMADKKMEEAMAMKKIAGKKKA